MAEKREPTTSAPANAAAPSDRAAESPQNDDVPIASAPTELKPHPPAANTTTRDAERIQILGEFHGEVMVFQPITIKEISLGGTQVESHFQLQLDSLHDFRLTLGENSVVIKGRVAHSSISDVDQEVVVYRSGIEFVDPPERVHEVIAKFIEAIMGGRLAR